MHTISLATVRSLGAVLFFVVSLLQFSVLPEAFQIEAYIGICLITGVIISLAGAAALLLDDRDRIWWYALAVGATNSAGFIGSRIAGLPLAETWTVGDWTHGSGLALCYTGAVLATLALWTLIRRHRSRRSNLPVLSAADRLLRSGSGRIG